MQRISPRNTANVNLAITARLVGGAEVGAADDGVVDGAIGEITTIHQNPPFTRGEGILIPPEAKETIVGYNVVARARVERFHTNSGPPIEIAAVNTRPDDTKRVDMIVRYTGCVV